MASSPGTAVFTPPSIDQLFSPRGQLLIQPAGWDREIVFAEANELSVATELTEAEFRSKSFPRSRLRKKSVFADSVTLTMTLPSLNRFTLAAMFMASPDSYLTQVAIASAPVEFEKPRVGDIFDVGGFGVTIGSVTDGAAGSPKAYVPGVHIGTDPATGRVEVLRIPDGAATTKIAIQRTVPAFTEADARQAFGILSTQGLRCKLAFRELGAEGPFNWLAEFWDVELRPTGELGLLGGDEFSNVELTGTVYAAAGKRPGEEYGRVVVIPKA